MSKEGSRNVLLGPYRSTELALEDRLSRKELGDVSEKLYNHDALFSTETDLNKIENMLSILGYVQEREDLYVRNCTKDFFYFSKDNDKVIAFSGKYIRLENVIDDIDDVNSILEFKQSYGHKSKFSKLTNGLMPLAFSTYVLVLDSFIKSSHSLGEDILFGFAIGYFGAKAITSVLYYGGFPDKVAKLSKNAASYSFGNTAYERLNNEFVKKALSNESLNPPKLETSELKPLPESKAIVEESPANNEQTSNVPKELEEYIERNIEYFGPAVKRLKFTKW